MAKIPKTIRAEQEVWDALEEKAKEAGVDTAEYCRRVLSEQAFETEPNEPPPIPTVALEPVVVEALEAIASPVKQLQREMTALRAEALSKAAIGDALEGVLVAVSADGSRTFTKRQAAEFIDDVLRYRGET